MRFCGCHFAIPILLAVIVVACVIRAAAGCPFHGLIKFRPKRRASQAGRPTGRQSGRAVVSQSIHGCMNWISSPASSNKNAVRAKKPPATPVWRSTSSRQPKNVPVRIFRLYSKRAHPAAASRLPQRLAKNMSCCPHLRCLTPVHTLSIWHIAPPNRWIHERAHAPLFSRQILFWFISLIDFSSILIFISLPYFLFHFQWLWFVLLATFFFFLFLSGFVVGALFTQQEVFYIMFICIAV